MSNSERFKLIVHGELSFAVEFDGQHMDEWSERDGAEAYIEFWSGKLTLERAEARREAETEIPTAWILHSLKCPEHVSECNECRRLSDWTYALRAKLAAPEKEETNG